MQQDRHDKQVRAAENASRGIICCRCGNTLKVKIDNRQVLHGRVLCASCRRKAFHRGYV